MVEAATGQATMVRNGALSPAWAPGGDRILFTAVRGADVLLFEQPFNAASIAQQPARGRGAAAGQGRFVGPSTGVAVAEDISKSGFILYRAGFAGGGGNTGDLFAFPPAAAEPITIANSPAMERNARFSPDGNWIAYQSDETGRNEVYVQPFPGSALQRQRVSLSGGTSPQWGRAGGELYFLGADSRLMVVTVTRSGDAKQPAIQLATPKALINAALPPGSEYDTVDDGNRFLVMTSAEETPPIIVLPNWAAGKQ
jgi:Tol biopolymer transport system component